MVPIQFGRIIKQYRESYGWTLEQLVTQIKKQPGYEDRYSKATVSKWESSNIRPPAEVVEILADIFSIPRGRLLEAAGYPYSEDYEKAPQIDTSLLSDIKELAAVIKSLVIVPEIIPVPEAIAHKIIPSEPLQATQTAAENFEEYFNSFPEKQALLNHFIELPISRNFKSALKQWKQGVNDYYALSGTTTDGKVIAQARQDAKVSARTAITTLFEAVEDFRWNR